MRPQSAKASASESNVEPSSAPYPTEEIASRYDQFARWYDLNELGFELLGLRRLRRRLLSGARGRVLEVAAGTGLNLEHYPADCALTAVDVSRRMLERAKERAARLARTVQFEVMDAETLRFSDGSFDTVVDALSLCTFSNPVHVLGEMRRVCAPGGQLLLLEHGRSDRRRLARWQDRRTNRHAAQLGCVWNREPLQLVDLAGLRVIHARRHFFGIFQSLVVAA